MHDVYLKETLSLAKSRRGFCAPNPAVGAIVVKNNQIISKGTHFASGHPHAEVEALTPLGENAKDAILYCSLEPCCHLEKKTPPCTDFITNAGIKKVIYGFRDPNPEVAGKGEQRLRAAGIECIQQSSAEITSFYQSYEHWCMTRKPFVTAKLALSLDGKIAAANGQRIAITGNAAQQFTHQQRQKTDAILTTAKTIQADNPLFNVRLADQIHSKPLYILDRQLTTPLQANIFTTAKSVTLFYDAQIAEQKLKAYQEKGAQCVPITTNANRLALTEILHWLGKTGIHDLWIEAGGSCFFAFAEAKLLQSAFIYIAPKILGNSAQPAFLETIDLFNNARYQWQILESDIICKLNWG